MTRSLSSGLVGILMVGGVLYYSGAGNWLMQQAGTIGGSCYSALGSLGYPQVTQPVCAGVTNAVAFLEKNSDYIGRQMQSVSALVYSPNQTLERSYDQFAGHIEDIAGTRQELKALLEKGPYPYGGTPKEQFKTAVNSFVIGNDYLQNRTTTGLALPWLRLGASQPQGYGLMSQLALGQVYAGGRGVQKDIPMAQYSYQQAQQSLVQLMSSQDPNAAQLLKGLPVSPNVLQQQIEQALRDLQVAKTR